MTYELLSPAGNFEKMKAAIKFGADAVYLAGQVFGMRAAADNFSREELIEAVKYAHERNVRVHVTVNTMPREYEYEKLKDYLTFLSEVGPDALIIGDIGVLALARKLCPNIELHISTQSSSVSSTDCIAWAELGAKRIVLARELTLDEIKLIRKNTPKEIEIETFIHGSMCISYSGRCLLSNFLTGRDANHGACAQPCRWNYTIKGQFEIMEEKRGNIPLPIEQIDGETFFFASKDLCMIEHVKDLMDAGISAFKIEGRMKSAYYTAVVTNTYRMAMDAILKGDYTYNPAWMRELESVSHREYETGYFYADCHDDARVATTNGYLKEKAYYGFVLEYNKETKEALCFQRNKMLKGAKVEVLMPGKIGVPMVVEELYDEDHNEIESTPHAGMKYYVKMPFDVEAGDIFRGGSDT